MTTQDLEQAWAEFCDLTISQPIEFGILRGWQYVYLKKHDMGSHKMFPPNTPIARINEFIAWNVATKN